MNQTRLLNDEDKDLIKKTIFNEKLRFGSLIGFHFAILSTYVIGYLINGREISLLIVSILLGILSLQFVSYYILIYKKLITKINTDLSNNQNIIIKGIVDSKKESSRSTMHIESIDYIVSRKQFKQIKKGENIEFSTTINSKIVLELLKSY